VDVPFDVEKTFGSKRPKVKAMIEGVPYRGTLVRMGSENHLLLILKAIREQIGRTFGDEIKVSVELDVEERVVTIPLELKRAFKSDRDAKSAFEKLSYTHQKEHVHGSMGEEGGDASKAYFADAREVEGEEEKQVKV